MSAAAQSVVESSFSEPVATWPPASWIDWVDRALDRTPPAADVPGSGDALRWVGRALFNRLCEHARPVGRGVLDEAERNVLHEAFARHARRRLDFWLTKVTVYEINVARENQQLSGETPEQRLASFFEQLSDDQAAVALYRRYPVLIGRIIRHFELLTEFVDEVARHLASDRDVLKREFGDLGPLSSAELGQGDSHLGARQVVVMRFARGAIVYKPRSLAVDQLYVELAGRLNAVLRHKLRMPRNVVRDTYGWQEFVESGAAEGTEAAERFYYSIGAQLALTYFTNATDIHFENILTTADGEPVLFDLETGFCNAYTADAEGISRPHDLAARIQVEALARCVTNTGILPSYRKDAAGLNALTDIDERRTAVSIDALVDPATDRIRLERQTTTFKIKSSLPSVDGVRTNPRDYVDRILCGFDHAYDHIEANRDELRQWIGQHGTCRVRTVLRNTSMYAMFLAESTHPVFASNAERLHGLLGKLGIMVEFQPAFRSVIDEEIAQILQFDVPAFSSRLDQSSIDGHSQRGLPFYGRSPLDTFFSKLAVISAADRTEQKRWITRMMGVSSYPEPPGDARARAVDRYLDNAVSFLLDRAEFAASDNSVSWLQVLLPELGGDIAPLSPMMYSGRAGLLTTFSAVAAHCRIAGVDRIHSALRQMLRRDAVGLVRDREDLGLFEGTSGVLYSLMNDAILHHDQELLEFVREQTRQAFADRGVDKSDVVAGAAGVMLFLCRLLDNHEDSTLESVLGRLGDSMLAARDEDASSWSSDHGRSLGGFSHGNSGIAHALICAGERLGREEFIASGLAAIVFEDTRFDAEQSNWPDVRPNAAERFNTTWCNGSPGYLLSRAIHYRRLPDQSRTCFAQGLAQLIAQQDYMDESLCHGTAGGLDVLIVIRNHLPDQVSQRDIDGMLQKLVRSPTRSGTNDCDAPGLMVGLAGMAYAVLRTRHPELQSVLSVFR